MLYRVTGWFSVVVVRRKKHVKLEGGVYRHEVVANSPEEAEDKALDQGAALRVGDDPVFWCDWQKPPEVVEVPEDQVMRRIGAPTLPLFS